ncbi:hypothetical protein SAICODRAFT_33540 [Saitoella complicata NRRL Y-17804]|uniref:uncharacterized protein n=1 Tax=Saitoella complicata (strain BCRC 22490 / CBS 7301 / JCM 7358 / NBRC 10748 / NRRL Y-17804) TaxID=698492 RepID=UPI000867B04F|nr:uncharacterized protein SAICODRAFT_33540 [Saitoella complicata NRRL Y-17804]ODQ55534.1 hypothetical protein SAICODRAFT_33540 [Saitoella complicata NRRL Y-17804]
MGTHPSALTGRPKSCIPNIFAKDWARECVEAAINSRLPPYALSKDEYNTFKGAINHVQVTNYLNIRNAVLWLWLRNPLCPVSREEAFGVCRDDRFVPLAEKIFEYLVRGGYINNGVIPIPSPLEVLGQVQPERSKSGKVVVVVGSGIAGLSAARQLEGLFKHFANKFPEDEELPKVMVVEARSRIGGRVYSRPIKADTREQLDLGEGRESTAEMGAMIVTGFDYGNPLGVLIKKQLALPYHHLRETDLHDETGQKVDKERDVRVERMFNDVLDRAAGFKEPRVQPKLVEGNKWDLDLGRDPSSEGGKTIAEVEKGEAEIPPMSAGVETGISTPSNESVFGAGLERMTGRPWHATGTAGKIPPIEALRRIGFEVEERDVETFQPRPADEPTLGDTMDAILLEFKELAKLTPEDMRMVNWHYANLEYANAANLRKLSLKHWDQDDGNEFRGAHSMVVGGYGQLARALALAPEKLDIKLRKSVQTVVYSDAQTMINGTMYQQPPVRVICHDGDVIGADAVIVTLPLGVLKSGDVAFEPALPEWKMGAISRLGFGLLNKVVLVYDECFWDREADMVGVLREPENGKDPMNQESYVDVRGRFYMFWNCYRTAGKPVLVALMAGNAAEAVEKEDDDVLIEEATTVLKKMHPGKHVLQPRESIVTRWKKDPYAKGSYSYVGPKATGEDYDLLQKDVDGRVYFAGEATCRTHPATVHGAYLSGLKAAKEVLEHFIGPINVPTDKHIVVPTEIATAMAKVKVESRRTQYKESWTQKAKRLKRERVQAAEEACEAALVEKLGEKPMKAKRRPANPFLVFQKESWSRIKAEADRIHQERTGNPNAKASRDEIRALLGKAWRDMSLDEQKPYREFTESNKAANSGSVADFNNQLLEWERQAETFSKTFMDAALAEPPSSSSSTTPNLELPNSNGGTSASKTAPAETETDAKLSQTMFVTLCRSASGRLFAV